MMLNPCSGCHAPCCIRYLVTVTSFDVFRIAKKTGMKPEEFTDFYPAKLLNQDWKTVLNFYDKGDLPEYSLLALKSWPCIFLEGGKCRIYEISPFACRRYPFDLDGSFQKRDCPLISQLFFRIKGPGADETIWEIDAYRKLVEEWNELNGKREDCMEFLMKKTADFKGYPNSK